MIDYKEKIDTTLNALYAGDDYSGYLLFPTHKDDEYFVLYYQC